MIRSLLEFIELLKQQDELIEINTYVNPELEVTEIVDRISKNNEFNKAILFTNNGTNFPLLVNLFGSEKRISLALHYKNLAEIEQKIESLFSLLPLPDSPRDKIRSAKKIASLTSLLPKVISRKGQCQQVIYSHPDLNMFPILKCWPMDGGKFITLPMVHTKDVSSGQRNVGMYRMQVFSNNTTGMHWHIHKTGAMHFKEAQKAGKKIPIAVTLGGDPVYTYCATAPLPEGVDEYILAGFLRNKRVNLVKCITQNIEVPDDCDIVMEGFIDPNEPWYSEGPFGDHTGFYSLPDEYPIFHVTAITHKRNAIYPATVVGVPPQEDYWFIKASERIFLPLLKKTLLPEIIDMRMPSWGVAHNLVIVQMESRYPQHATKVAHALWGNGQMMFNKILMVTNQSLNNLPMLFQNISMLSDWNKRIMLSYGPMDVLEHAGVKPIEGGKLLFNAIIEEHELDINNFFSEETQYAIEKIFSPLPCLSLYANYGIFILMVDTNYYVNTTALKNKFNTLPFSNREIKIFLIDKSLPIHNIEIICWHFLAHFDASLDTAIIPLENQNYLLLFNGAVKSRNGKSIPNPVVSDKQTIQKIDSVWANMFTIPMEESPSRIINKLTKGDHYLIDFNNLKKDE